MEKVIDCQSKGLDKVPNFLNFIGEEFDCLNLGNNKISSLGRDAFKGLSVRRIDLSNNPDLTSFSNYAFNGVQGLQVLLIENGRLSSVPVAFQTLTEIQELHLKNNKIRRLPENAFKAMTGLRYLDLSKNKAEFLRPFTSFQTLTQLEHVNLEENGLYNMPIEALRDSPNISTLILSHNKIRLMPLDALRTLTRLSRLELVGNPLNLPAGALFPGLNLDILSIGDCNLAAITPEVLSTIRQVRNLTIRGCQVTSIPRGTFKMLNNLQYLDISGNPITLTADIFYGVENKLTTLKLDKLNLREYPLKLLARFPRLKDISLNHNNITFLPGGIFKNLPYRGSRIYVENNMIRKVSNHVVDGAQKPVSLFLANNKIKSLAFIVHHPCHFDHTYVDLSGNPVHCNCKTYRMVQHKIFDLIGTCHTPHHHRDLELVWRPNREPQVQHFEQSVNATEECQDQPRHQQRYDCACATWLDYHSPRACSVIGQASHVVPLYSFAFTLVAAVFSW